MIGKARLTLLTAIVCMPWSYSSVVADPSNGPWIINTAGEKGAYHSAFCPVLVDRLETAGFGGTCRVSNGTSENLARVAASPTEIGFGQLDVLALDMPQYGGASQFRRLRVDDVRECIFAVTRNRALTNFGEVAVRAAGLKFILPPETSGSAGTFRFLQRIDPYAFGQARDVLHAADADEAIRIALASEDAVALFVQVPDPDNARFKLIDELGGHLVPVIDRNILEQKLEGSQVYFPQETQIEAGRWLRGSAKAVTACTPLVVFTGTSERIPDAAARARHAGMVSAVMALRGEELLPQQSFFARVLKRTRELTAVGAQKFVEFSEQAREKAAPLIEKAREAARQAVEQAKPVKDQP
ncbi:MAG: hypothetical protein NW217_12440 [Hyphomicrobiaceae bacterium]|nr:hypothetical protein [Hyphomicrobiaceae bacterium]